MAAHPNQIHNERRTPRSRDARFNDDGDEVENVGEWTYLDRYLEIAAKCDGPLTAAGFQALNDWKRSRQRRHS